MSKSEYWDNVMHRRLSRRRILQAGAVAGAGLWAGSILGCSGGNDQSQSANQLPGGATAGATPQPKYGGTFRTWTNADPKSNDPHIETAASGNITRGYNGVLKWDREGTKLVNDLAVSYEQPDDVTFIFKLNQGVKFHNIPPVNGRELTAEDVKFSIERQMTNQPGKFNHASFFLGKVAKIEAVDRYTVKFTNNYPDATFLSYMGSVWTKIIAREAVDKYGELTEVVIGTGPFMLTKVDKSVETVMTKNPDYFKKGLPYLDAISIRVIPDQATLTASYLGGDLDVCWPAPSEIDMVKKAKPNWPFIPTVSMFPFVFRTQPYDDKRPLKPPFDDKRVRQALQLAINKQECIDSVHSGNGVAAVGIIPPDRNPWALPDSDAIKQDVNKAKQLLAQAGYPNGFKAELWTQNVWYYTDIATVLKGQFAKLGVDTDIKILEPAQYYTKIYTYDYQMNVHTITGSEEPDEYLSPYFGTNGTFYRWANPDIQKKIDDQKKIMDQQKRVQAILEIQRLLMDDAPQVNLYSAKYPVFLTPRVQNYLVPWNQFDASFMETTWLSE